MGLIRMIGYPYFLGKKMKHLFTLSIALIVSTCSHITLTCDTKNDTFLPATEKFKRMRVAQIRNLDMRTLNAAELYAFKALAKSIFSQEIASADCFSQANKRKYEVMYQKIGEVDAFCDAL